MSLNKTILKTAIKNITLTGYTTISSAATAWSNSYDDYTNGVTSYAQDQSTDRVVTVNKSALQAGLVTAFSSGTAIGAANGIETACISYWAGAIFGISFPPTLLDPLAISDVSAVVSFPGSGLSASLQAIFSVLSSDADSKANDIATAFDNYTKTVRVLCNYLKTNPAPPPPIIPGVITLSIN